ncbi:MAG TPA: ATP-binding protein [Gemmatimonadaceae bacterium]|jgi:signal transduction histidine kinase
MTVRARLTLWYGGLLVLIVVAFAIAGYAYLDRLEHDRIDRMLHEQSEIVMQAMDSTRAHRGEFDATAAEKLLPTLHDLRARGIRAWIFDESGMLRVATEQVQEGEGPEEERAVLGSPVPASMLRELARRRASSITEVQVGAHAARLLSIPLPDDLGRGTLFISYSLREVAELLARARFDAALAIMAALVLSLGAGYVLARGAMAPVAAMSNQAALIGGSNLHERVPVHNQHDELGTLATTFNGLLDRVAEALSQQRRFMADASHELRTPVAILRSETDIVLRSDSRTIAEYREALEVVQAASERLSHTVEDIFLLTLVDAKEARTSAEPLYLNDLVSDECRSMRSVGERRGIAIDCTLSIEAPYVGDEKLLQRLIANLLDNAIKYSPVNARVEACFERAGDAFVLSVSNGGPGIPLEARAHVFDRFFRADAARTISLGEEGRIAGGGLGLPISRWIAQLHGGTLELSHATSTRTTFTLRLPVTPALERAH